MIATIAICAWPLGVGLLVYLAALWLRFVYPAKFWAAMVDISVLLFRGAERFYLWAHAHRGAGA